MIMMIMTWFNMPIISPMKFRNNPQMTIVPNAVIVWLASQYYLQAK